MSRTQTVRERELKEDKPNKTAIVQARVDSAIRDKADNVLRRLGMSTSEAIRVFLGQVALTRGLPFEVRLPDFPLSVREYMEIAWDDENDRDFEKALGDIESKFGGALKKLADYS
ncbi:MAG: type II toxin-antitoxin system RelB/DinJ family antitoxin [Synergistaceae bacterium]|nr:type II toxin-antitoxin system RelB/DinJ family antitoxin [Synergistaceae bacterium]